MRLSTSVYAVSTIRTASGVRSWLRRSSSTPVMPGIRWSVTMTATSGSAARRATASSPWPAGRSRWRRRPRDHRGAPREARARGRRADGPRQDPTGADADPDVEGGSPVGGPARGQPPHRLHHVGGGPDRPQGDIGPGLRDAEEGDDLVADQLLHRALVAEDHVDHLAEVLVQELDHHRSGGRLDEAGGAAAVREENGGLAPLTPQLPDPRVGGREGDPPGRPGALSPPAHPPFPAQIVLGPPP